MTVTDRSVQNEIVNPLKVGVNNRTQLRIQPPKEWTSLKLGVPRTYEYLCLAGSESPVSPDGNWCIVGNSPAISEDGDFQCFLWMTGRRSI